MTLGQFREITEGYGDDCLLLLNKVSRRLASNL